MIIWELHLFQSYNNALCFGQPFRETTRVGRLGMFRQIKHYRNGIRTKAHVHFVVPVCDHGRLGRTPLGTVDRCAK